MERVQSKYPYKSFGQNLDYDEGTQTYKRKELYGSPVIYATVPDNWEFSPKRKGGRGYKRFKKSSRNGFKKRRSYGKRTRKYHYK